MPDRLQLCYYTETKCVRRLRSGCQMIWRNGSTTPLHARGFRRAGSYGSSWRRREQWTSRRFFGSQGRFLAPLTCRCAKAFRKSEGDSRHRISGCLRNRNDVHHAWALHVSRGVTDPLLTCDAVLAETAFHLGDPLLVIDLIRTGLVQPAFVLADHTARIAELATRYRDRRPGLADLCLIRMSELYPQHPVITTDLAEFRVYRRHRREVIPLIHPNR